MLSTCYFCPFLMKLEFFSTIFFSKNPQVTNNIKILPVEAELLHADSRRNRLDEANGGFSQFFESD